MDVVPVPLASIHPARNTMNTCEQNRHRTPLISTFFYWGQVCECDVVHEGYVLYLAVLKYFDLCSLSCDQVFIMGRLSPLHTSEISSAATSAKSLRAVPLPSSSGYHHFQDSPHKTCRKFSCRQTGLLCAYIVHICDCWNYILLLYMAVHLMVVMRMLYYVLSIWLTKNFLVQ